ncbi:MAG: VOC family protein [Actinobacteria bacterium]|nr:VOC family protein [Actinomycetota bacterium]
MEPTTDRGLTHVALTVADVDRSIAFYRDYGEFEVVHRRTDETTGHSVAWISDLTRPFVIVLVEAERPFPTLGGFNHLGVGVASREEVDRLAAKATGEGRSVLGPLDSGYPVGYWAFIPDPDGHNLEVSYGQEVGLAVRNHRTSDPVTPPG